MPIENAVWTLPAEVVTGMEATPDMWNALVDNINNGPTATSISTLNALFIAGAPSDGSRGRLRIGGSGSAPFYDFLDVVYNATYSKWISATTETLFIGTKRTTTSGAGDVSVQSAVASGGLFSAFLAKFSDYNTAGLTPQVRFTANAQDETGGGTLTVIAYTASANDSAAASSFTAQWSPGAVTLTSANTNYAWRSGWQSIATTDLTKDILFVKYNHNANGTHGTSSTMSAELRWIA